MAPDAELSLFVFIDALGWEILQNHRFLEGVLRTRRPLDTILGYSCTCDPTIISGKLPSEHGHFSFFYYSPESSPFRGAHWLSLLPSAVADRGRVRRQISRFLRYRHGFTGYFQIYQVPFEHLPQFDYLEKRDIYQPGGLVAGTPTIFDYLRSAGVRYSLSDWRKSEQENLSAMRRDLEQGDIRWGYLYLAALDAVLHAEGTDGARVAAKISWYDTQIRSLLDVAHKSYRRVRLFIFSDHGMTNTSSTCDLISTIDALGLEYGRDYVAMYDSTMARFWFLRGDAEARIRGALAEIPSGTVLTDDQLRREGVFFPDYRFGQLLFLMNPGVLLCPSYMGRSAMAGMHGYDPQHKDSVAAFVSSEDLDDPPRRLDDLYDLMRLEADRGSEGRRAINTSEQESLCVPVASTEIP